MEGWREKYTYAQILKLVFWSSTLQQATNFFLSTLFTMTKCEKRSAKIHNPQKNRQRLLNFWLNLLFLSSEILKTISWNHLVRSFWKCYTIVHIAKYKATNVCVNNNTFENSADSYLGSNKSMYRGFKKWNDRLEEVRNCNITFTWETSNDNLTDFRRLFSPKEVRRTHVYFFSHEIVIIE